MPPSSSKMADPRRGPQATPKRPFENLRANARQGAMNEEETGAGFGSRSERIKRARFDAQGSISGVAGPSRTSNQLAIVADPSSSALLDSLNSATFDPHQQSLPMSLLPSTIPPSIEHHSPVLQAQDAPENFSYSPEPLLETRVLAHSPRLMSEPVYISSDDDDGSILPLPSLPALRRRTIALPNILEGNVVTVTVSLDSIAFQHLHPWFQLQSQSYLQTRIAIHFLPKVRHPRLTVACETFAQSGQCLLGSFVRNLQQESRGATPPPRRLTFHGPLFAI